MKKSISPDLARVAMEEWDALRGVVAFEDFGERLGITQWTWEQIFKRAAAAGDRRAVGRDRVPGGGGAVRSGTLRWPGTTR